MGMSTKTHPCNNHSTKGFEGGGEERRSKWVLRGSNGRPYVITANQMLGCCESSLAHREGLHQLYARAVGIVEIELPPLVAADLWRGELAARGGRGAIGDGLERCLNIGDEHGDVVQDATLLAIYGRRNQHVFEVIGAVRHLHVDPARHIVSAAAAPDFR